MREQIHTIPLSEAFETQDECPFCHLERKAEQSAIRFVAGPGASYMEPDVREATDRAGFCRNHMHKLYTYGNHLGSALMMQTHMTGLLLQLQTEIDNFEEPPKKSLMGKKKAGPEDPMWKKLRRRVDSCYICDKINYNMDRYMATFFTLLKEKDFRAKVENSRGFCMHHFSQLLEAAEEHLQNGHREWFYPTVFRLMQENMMRVKEDLDWFVDKHDYRNTSAPWKNSKDAVARSMQKLEGLYPADKPYKDE